MDNSDRLENLKKEMENNASLPLSNANLVFGEGNPNSQILFIGEAPGHFEDIEKRPFVGRSGKLLDKLIESINWDRNDVYITNIVKHRPPENRDPTPAEIETYTPYLTRQIEIINPKIIAPLGRFAMNYFLPIAKISNDQGKLFWWRNRLVIPLYHPAAALRSTKVSHKLQESFLKLPIALEKFDSFLKEKSSNKNGDSDIEKIEQITLF